MARGRFAWCTTTSSSVMHFAERVPIKGSRSWMWPLCGARPGWLMRTRLAVTRLEACPRCRHLVNELAREHELERQAVPQ